MEALEQCFSRMSPPARASGNLEEKLEAAFVRPVVRQREAELAEQNTYEGDVREVVALCDHLRAYENIRFVAMKDPERRFVFFGRLRGVSIQTVQSRFGVMELKLLFDRFGSHPYPEERKFRLVAIAARQER